MELATSKKFINLDTHGMRLSLRTNFLWNFLGNVSYGACQWAILVVLAKLGSPEMVGQFSLGLAICLPINLFANLQLRQIQATDADNRYSFEHYLALRMITVMLSVLVIAFITSISKYSAQTTLIILAMALARAIESMSDIFYGLYLKKERLDRLAISMMGKGLLSLLALSIIVYFTNNVFLGILAQAFALALNLFCYDWPTGAQLIIHPDRFRHGPRLRVDHAIIAIRPRWSLPKLKKLAWLAFPLGVVMVLNSLNTNIPRYIIEKYLGERDLGIFSAIAYPMLVGGTLVFAMGQAAVPRLAKTFANKELRAFRHLLSKLALIGAIMGLVCITGAYLAGQYFLSIIYRPEYAQHFDVFILLMIAAAISYVGSFLGYGVTSARFFQIQVPVGAVVLVVTLISSFYLVPSLGMRGAALTIIISQLIILIAYFAIIVYAFINLNKDISHATNPDK